MKEDLIDPHVQFPGLQIFSSWKSGSKRPRGFQSTAGRSICNPQHLPSDETLALNMQSDSPINQFGSWIKLPERKSLDLHDYSPTIVESDYFEKFDAPERTETVSFWTRIISEVFKELSDLSNDQFIEEFQYTVISSDFLNDPNGFRFSFTGKKSIMDFHKRSAALQRNELGTIPTKYGRLRISSSGQFTLIRTLDYLSTVFYTRKVLTFLKRQRFNRAKCRRVLTSVLIALYLAIQQEYFHTQYTRYKALVSLKKMLTSLQRLSTLMHSFRIKLKELSIYKPLSTSKSLCDPTMTRIKDILCSCLDLVYYKMRTIAENLIPFCSTASLKKYCAMYNLEMSDLFHYLTETAGEVEDKCERFSVMRKFTLCTLISLCCCNNASNGTMVNILSRLFPDSIQEIQETSHVPDAEKYRMVTENLQQLNEFVIQLTSSFVNHKHLLRSYDDVTALNNDLALGSKRAEGRPKNRHLSQTLQSLKRLESFLVASHEEELSEEMRDVVTGRLHEITSAWQCYDTPKTHYDRSFVSSPNQGFSLNVLKKPSSPLVKLTSKNGNSRLEDEVAFARVEDTQSDIEFDSDREHHNSHDTSGYVSTRSESNKSTEMKGKSEESQNARKLTDDELRRKLNEGIFKLAVENRQGREKIRTQKSFELLRHKDPAKMVHRQASNRSRDSMTIVKSRPPNESNFSSEDSIPVLYELEELLDKQQ